MAERPEQIRLLLIDDHALFRESVSRLLSREAGFEIVASCGSPEEALHILRRRPIDLVLLDYDLGNRTGGDFIHSVRKEGLNVKILVVTAGVQSRQAAQLIHEGVSGIFLKRDSVASLAESIRGIMAGRVSFEQNVFQRAMTGDPVEAEKAGTGAGTLTRRERTVLAGIFEGLTNKEIAGQLGVSESSVKATLQQLFTKTGVRTRSQLVRVALERFRADL
jgi:DNA-binding NarL/FixJ family response regulator